MTNQINPFVAKATIVTLQQLNDDEAVAFHLFLEMGGQDPKTNMAWPKVEPLYTQQLSGGGVGMHADTKAASLA